MQTIAQAVAHMHSHDIVHLDLKPSNILLDAGGQPFVMDFGIAQCGKTSFASGTVVGTPSYMSPEQATGRVAAIGPLSDVYCLGSILYRLLCCGQI